MPGGKGEIQKEKRLSATFAPNVLKTEDLFTKHAFTYEDIYDMEHDRDLSEAVMQIFGTENSVLTDNVKKSMPEVEAKKVSEGTPSQAVPAVKNSLELRREQKRRAAEAKKHSPVGDHVSYVLNRDIRQWEQERANSIEGKESAQAFGEDAKLLLMPMINGYLRSPGGAVPDENEEAKRQHDSKLIDIYSQGEKEVLIGMLANEVRELNIRPDMFTEEYLEKNSVELIKAYNKLDALSKIMGDPQYEQAFETMTEAEREALKGKVAIAPAFYNLLNNRLAAKGIDINGEYIGKAKIKTALEAPLPEYRKKYEREFEEALRAAELNRNEELQTQHEEPEGEQQRVMAPAANIFRYGVPEFSELENFLKEKSGVDEKVVERLMWGRNKNVKLLRETCNNYFDLLNAKTDNDSIKSVNMLRLYHARFVDLCAQISAKTAGSRDSDQKRLAGAFGFAAMRAQTYAGMVASLKEELNYSFNVENHAEKLKEQMRDNGLGAQYEGTHMGKEYIENLSDEKNYNIPRMDTELRNQARKVKYTDDQGFVSIVLTCEAYENFLRSAQVPPCRTEAEQNEYINRINMLCHYLLSYNDRIAGLTMNYLNRNAVLGRKNKKKRVLCEALQNTILNKNSKQYNYERVALLAQRLRNNDFSDLEFNNSCTGVILSEALRNTRLDEVTLDARYYSKAGDALSDVYIRNTEAKANNQGAGNVVFRKGSDYDKTTYSKYFPGAIPHLNEVKGDIASFYSLEGRRIDSHKTRRDVAVSLVDRMLGANVIAASNQVIFKFENVDSVADEQMKTAVASETLGTAMAEAEGVSAHKYCLRYMIMNRKEAEVMEGSAPVINLGNTATMNNLFWLQAVDVICGAPDRHMNNIFVDLQGDHSVKFTGIDNDLSFGADFPLLENMEDYSNYLKEKVEVYGAELMERVPFFIPVLENAFPCVSRPVYDSVMNLNSVDFADTLRGYLRDDEIVKAVERLRGLQNYFARLETEDKVLDFTDENDIDNAHKILLGHLKKMDKTSGYDERIRARVFATSYFSLLLNGR